MRGIVSDFQLIHPKNLAHALDLISEKGTESKVIAGGTDLMVQFESGRLKPTRFINIWNLKDLGGISISKQEIRIGGLASYSEIIEHPILKKEFSMLVDSARATGAIAIQNRGTIGGNIANASPAADTPPVLLAYDAMLELVSKNGSRLINLCDFYLGYKKNQLRSDELIKSIVLKRPEKTKKKVRTRFVKIGTRKAQAISKIVLASYAEIEKKKLVHLRIGAGSLSPFTKRLVNLEKAFENLTFKDVELKFRDLDKILKEDIQPISDIRSTDQYRFTVTKNLIEDFFRGLIDE